MRTFLTLIAVALVAALTAALVAPMFIDWSNHRAQVEAELSDVLGGRVAVSGPIDIRFLPTPYVELAGVKVEDPASGALLTCDGLRLEAALASLPSGRFRFTLARLDHPVMTLMRGKAGTLRLPHWRLNAQPDRVALDRIVVGGGELRVIGGDASLDIGGLAIDASAGSLLGPYRGTVGLKTGQIRAEIRFATGAFERNALPVKLEIDAKSGLPSGLFDGAVSLAPQSGGALGLSYSGSASVAGAVMAADVDVPMPWSVAGSLRGDLKEAKLDNLVARFGPDERALDANGAAEIKMGATPNVSVDLQSKQLNIDALLRREGQDSVAPARALAAFESIVQPLAAHNSLVAFKVAFSTPTVIVGAQTLGDVAIDAHASTGSSIDGSLAASLPGDSSLRLTGGLELGSAAQFKGRLAATIGDFAQLRDWAGRDAPALTERLSLVDDILPYRKATASGDVEISRVSFSARNLQLLVDRTSLEGAMAFTQPLGGQRGRLFMDLRGDALDVDTLPNLKAGSALLGDIDLSLALEAKKLRVARVGEAAIEGGSLSLKMTKTGDDVSLDRLSVAGLGDAAVEARGAWGAKERWLSVQLKAERLREFAAMIARVAPSQLSRLLMQRADALSPTQATFEARGAGGELVDTVKAEGSAGASQFTLKVDRATAPAQGVVADVTLDAPEGAPVLRQLGLTAPASPTGHAHFEASASGRWDAGLDGHASASIAGANLTWRGRVKPEAIGGDDTPLFGTATVKSDNGMALLTALGLASSSTVATVPVDLTGDFTVRGAELHFARLAGTVAGAKVSGRLDWRPPTPAPASAAEADVALARSLTGEAPISAATQIDGELAFDHAGLAALLSLPLGAPQPTKPGARWSDIRFAPQLASLPPLDVQVKIDTLDVADGIAGRDASARLKIERGVFDLGDLSMDVAGGHTSGRLTLRRDGAVATLTGQVTADVPALDKPALRGGLGAEISFASTGQSPSALVSGLVGEGQLHLTGIAVPRLDPGALSRELVRTQAPDARIDETNVTHDLGIDFDKQAMSIPDGATPVAMNGGVIHIGPLRLSSTQSSQAVASADFDLRSRDLGIHATFTEANGGKFWSGPPPSVAVTVSGPVDAPARQIDASAFVAGLSAQAIARESDRIASLEADIRERAAFNRRLKAERFMREREEEEQAYEAEQARLKSEQDRKRVEDELLKANELRQDKPAAPVAPSPPVSPPLPPDLGEGNLSAPTPPTRPKAEDVDPTANGLY